MISLVDPKGTKPDRKVAKDPYAMIDGLYLPQLVAGRPVKICVQVRDGTSKTYAVRLGILNAQAHFRGESSSCRQIEVICKRPWSWPWKNRCNEPHQAMVTIIPRKDSSSPELLITSTTNAFMSTCALVKESSGAATHQSLETGGSGGHTVRRWFHPGAIAVMTLVMAGIMGSIWMVATEPTLEPRARHVSIAELDLPTDPSLVDGGEADAGDTGDTSGGPALEDDDPVVTVDAVTAASTTYSYDCQPYDPEGMSWYRYSKQPGTEGQQIVICGQDGMFTTSGFHRDDSGNKVWDDLRPYPP